MERFSVECLACQRNIGEATRAESVPLAVAHLQQHHRAVGFPHPALELIRLHPFYTLDVLSTTNVEPQPADAAAAAQGSSPGDITPGASGERSEADPPADQN